MSSIGQIIKCEVCGRKFLVERIMVGVNHTAEILVTCLECLDDKAKVKTKELYNIDLESDNE